MSMPPFPSLCDVYRTYASPTRVIQDLPCRIVPSMRVAGGSPYTGAWASITHWVDYPRPTVINGGYRQTIAINTSLTYTFSSLVADFILCKQLPVEHQILVVLGTEDRYVDTPDWHRRAWCHWVHEVPGFVPPG